METENRKKKTEIRKQEMRKKKILKKKIEIKIENR